MMTIEQFAALVDAMRLAQRQWFRKREGAALAAARQWERKVDDAIDVILLRQGTLPFEQPSDSPFTL